jgi:hypothetical protein
MINVAGNQRGNQRKWKKHCKRDEITHKLEHRTASMKASSSSFLSSTAGSLESAQCRYKVKNVRFLNIGSIIHAHARRGGTL